MSKTFPRPKAKFLPNGPHKVDAPWEQAQFKWQDESWQGCKKQQLVIYELHVGTFTKEGTFEAAAKRLEYLLDLGVTAIELMPVAECPGRWNWGYDGVGFYAPNHNFGTPDDLKSLIDKCHQSQIAVILDVVYNHIGPEGNYLSQFGPYFSKKHGTPWGDAFDFDGPNKELARNFIIDNAIYWLHEFHFDGLRLDAIHYMFDESDYPIQQEICDRVSKFKKTVDREIHLIGEANIYDHDLICCHDGSRNTYDAIWADDLMHAIYSIAVPHSKLTARDYRGAIDVEEALTHGYLYRGPKIRRTDDEDRAQIHALEKNRDYISSLIMAVQTHDSVGNHPHGKRLHQLANHDFQKAAAAIILLYPAIPMLFMGEESACDSPFLFFADFQDERLRKGVDKGRKAEFPEADWNGAVMPSDERAFYDSKITFPEPDNEMFGWYQQVLKLRKQWNEKFIDPNRMKIATDLERGIFSIVYETASNESAFVVARICDPNHAVEPAEISIDGDVILNSAAAQPNTGDETANKISLGTNQAIIGVGSVSW